MHKEYIELYQTYTKKYGPKTAIFLMVGSFYELYDIQDSETGETQANVREIVDYLGIQIAPKKVVRCMDSFLISYTGIIKFVSYTSGFLTEMRYDKPIDNFLQCYFKSQKGNPQYWVWPSLTMQGSQNGIYKSSIQDSSVTDGLESA